ncbi:hypothetical protein [Agromyces bauzanensis]|uniref:Uncharacterized protein n=1 Tax=Agromyces bauzanensis TaxID=1308924 RepID=A0A917UQQ4_9MICO|nr:hypothetical protein [Agromyces bauzanensis]GGJ76471.1 hypothetical protein GCM10011372_13370 [Agromyces bauzanensis]
MRKEGRPALVLSIVSLVVSTVTAVFLAAVPLAWRPVVIQPPVASKYVEHLVTSGYRSAYLAAGLSEKDSPAWQFAEAIKTLRAAYEGAVTESNDGTWRGVGDGIEGCLDLSLVYEDCVVFANFEFNENDRVVRFTIDGIPVEQLYRPANWSAPATAEDGVGQFRAYTMAELFNTDYTRKILVYQLDRSPSRADPLPFDLLYARVQYADLSEVTPEDAIYDVTGRITQWSRGVAFFDVPYNSEFIQLCWTHDPPDATVCDWIYNL